MEDPDGVIGWTVGSRVKGDVLGVVCGGVVDDVVDVVGGGIVVVVMVVVLGEVVFITLKCHTHD